MAIASSQITDLRACWGHYARGIPFAVASGSADALTGAFTPATPTLGAATDGYIWRVRATAANATTTPTFAPDGQGPWTIKKINGAALNPGDIAGASHELLLGFNYNSGTPFIELLNPAPAKFAGDSGSGGTAGLVPPPGAGDAAANKVLGAGGSWVSSASVTPAAITGFLPTSISGTNTTAAVTIGAGNATDSTAAAAIKTTGNTSWAVSNGNAINGYSGGTTLPNSSNIHFFMCSGSSGTGSFASTSLTPTFPTGYNTYARRIFSTITNSSGTMIAGYANEIAGGAMQFNKAAYTYDWNSTASTGPALLALSIPGGIVLRPLLSLAIQYGSTGSDGHQLLGPGNGGGSGMYEANRCNLGSQTATNSQIGPPTNTSAHIYFQQTVGSGSGLSVGTLMTNGWIDDRRS
ncbi:MAG: hypothetical protein ACREEN_01010 [Stellaceae bacterium]